MITEKGKAFIARNFGVSNCYALDDVVSCTVYSKGTPSERVLNTPTIVFLLVTDIVDWVKTSTGRFTLADLVAGNEGKYISMTEALDITAYCIPEEPVTPPVKPPVTPPVTPPVRPPVAPLEGPTVPPVGADYEIVSPSVNCDSRKCYARFNLKNNSRSASVYIRLEVDSTPRYKRYAYILRGGTKAQVVSTSIAGLSAGYHNLTIAVGRVIDTDTYTHRFLVGVPSIEPPVTPTAKITAAEIAAELGRRGPIDTAALPTAVGKNKWYLMIGEWGGKWVSYVETNFIKSISLDIAARNPPTRAADISLKTNHNAVSALDSSWVLARLGELPFTSAPPTAKITKAGIITELRSKAAIDSKAVSTVPAVNRWYMYRGRLNWHTANFEKGIEIRNLQTRNPPTQTKDISLTENKTSVNELDSSWVLARLAELIYMVAPTPPPTAVLPAPTNIRVTDLRPDYAYVEWDGILECCSDPGEQREYCGCEFGITLNGSPKKKVFADSHPGTDCEELRPSTRYTLEIQTRSPPNIYSYKNPSEKVSFTFTTPAAPPVTPQRQVRVTATSPIPLYFCAGGNPPARIPLTVSAGILGEASQLAIGTREEDILEYYHVDFREERTLETVAKGYAIKATWNLGKGTVHFDVQAVAAPPVRPPVRPPVTPLVKPPITPPTTEVSEAIKEWIVANYGDGTRVTSGGWLKLYDANMAGSLAPLPAGYTKADITEEVVLWAKSNPNWESQTVCGWINTIGVARLTEDHGRYIHSLAIGWTTLAKDFYNKLSPKPAKPSAAIVTEDNGRGVYGYAIGWNTLANEFTGCKF